MKLLYLEAATWEFDFIRYDLLSNIKNLEVEYFNKSNMTALMKRGDLVNNNIFVITHHCNLMEVINVVKIIKPLVIFQLSDEYGGSPQWTVLEKYTKVLFRQHNHRNYKYGHNNFHLPLGYVQHYLNKTASLTIVPKKISERKINCSFIGAEKSDRLIMANAFKEKMSNTNIQFVNNNWNINELPCVPADIFNVYSNSIFVINGKGNCNLDCFRIYEAIVAGAIPVIVGNVNDINNTFNYNNNIIPLIYSDNW